MHVKSIISSLHWVATVSSCRLIKLNAWSLLQIYHFSIVPTHTLPLQKHKTKPSRKTPETPRLKFVTLFFLRLNPLKNFLHCLPCNWCCVKITMPKRKGGKVLSIISAWEKVWENSFPIGRIVRKQVYSAKSGQIFKPLALIQVGSCDSSISYVLFIMALYLKHKWFWKTSLTQFLEGPGDCMQ